MLKAILILSSHFDSKATDISRRNKIRNVNTENLDLSSEVVQQSQYHSARLWQLQEALVAYRKREGKLQKKIVRVTDEIVELSMMVVAENKKLEVSQR